MSGQQQGLSAEEREALWQASLDYWRRMPWWDAGDGDGEDEERDIFLGGEGRNIAAAVERILAARLDALTAENERLVGVVAAVEALADEWENFAGPESEAWRVFGPQIVTVPHAVSAIRAALGAGGEGER